MALELQVTVALIDTEPEVAGNPGVIVRSERCSTMTFEGGTVSDAYALCGARVTSIGDDVLTDFKGQLQIAERFVEEES